MKFQTATTLILCALSAIRATDYHCENDNIDIIYPGENPAYGPLTLDDTSPTVPTVFIKLKKSPSSITENLSKVVYVAFGPQNGHYVNQDKCSMTFNDDNWNIPQSLSLDGVSLFENNLVPKDDSESDLKTIDFDLNTRLRFINDTNTENQVKGCPVYAHRTIATTKKCSSHGDPHIISFDCSRNVDVQQVGAHWLVNHNTLKIQSLQYACNGKSIFCNEAVAVQYGRESIIIAPYKFYDNNTSPYVFLSEKSAGGLGKGYKDLSIVQVLNPLTSGMSFEISLQGKFLMKVNSFRPPPRKWRRSDRFDRGYLNIDIYLPAKYKNKVSGICGNYNGICEESERGRNLLKHLVTDACHNLFAGAQIASDEDPYSGNQPITRCNLDKPTYNKLDRAPCCTSTTTNEGYPSCGLAENNRTPRFKLGCSKLESFLEVYKEKLTEFETTCNGISKREEKAEVPPLTPDEAEENQKSSLQKLYELFKVTTEESAKIEANCRKAMEIASLAATIVGGQEGIEVIISKCIFDTVGHFNLLQPEAGAADTDPNVQKREEQVESDRSDAESIAQTYVENLLSEVESTIENSLILNQHVIQESIDNVPSKQIEEIKNIDKSLPDVPLEEGEVAIAKRRVNGLDLGLFLKKVGRHYGFGNSKCRKDCYSKRNHGWCTKSGCKCAKEYTGLYCKHKTHRLRARLTKGTNKNNKPLKKEKKVKHGKGKQ